MIPDIELGRTSGRMTFARKTNLWMSVFSEIAYHPFEECHKRLTELGAGWIHHSDELSNGVDTEFYLAVFPTYQVLAYRGSTDLTDWLDNADYKKVEIPWFGSRAKAHRGFTKEAGLASGLLRQFYHTDKPLFITGHSKGAAQALLESAYRSAHSMPYAATYVYGSPRVFNWAAAGSYDFAAGNKTYRIVNNNDIVCRLPPRRFGYRHVGTHVHYDRNSNLVYNPSLGFVFLDRLIGRFNNFSFYKDGTVDHNIGWYVSYSNKAAAVGGKK